ncbi:MAG TPA: dynamin family protein [Ktedonobacteraceae bacterium]|nr:dynamin family protein [Ktedonobacteraceae bacterium]
MDYMDKVEQDLKDILKKAAVELREARSNLVGDPAARLEQIATQVSQPCIVAVVGQVKAGKSSFINALLREDLAKVGTTETTATINYFCYSKGELAVDRTVRCFYRNGQSSYVDRAFLDNLQGNDIETLRRAAEIDHLEYYLRNRVLERVTLVDTPGTGAAVDEHQNVTAEFLRLYQQLRERHHEETRKLGDTADAIIYLIGAVAGNADQKFLEQFHELTGGQSEAFNAVGVMSKIDLYPEVVERRDELANKIATQLKEYLNDVVPISAGIRQALDTLLANNRAGFEQLAEAVRAIAPGKAAKFFDNPNLYLKNSPDWPLPVERRKQLQGNMDWMVFSTMARVLVDHGLNLEKAGKELNAIAGFDHLKELLELHIFQRSRLLRYYNKTKEARQVLDDLRYLPKSHKGDADGVNSFERYLKIIQHARRAGCDPLAAQELEVLVKKNLALQLQPLDMIVERLDRELASIFHDLEHYNDDFGALQKVIKHIDLFSDAEVNELRTLFGLFGLETGDQLSLEYIKRQQIKWRTSSMKDQLSIRRDVANQAVVRYGLIQKKLLRN